MVIENMKTINNNLFWLALFNYLLLYRTRGKWIHNKSCWDILRQGMTRVEIRKKTSQDTDCSHEASPLRILESLYTGEKGREAHVTAAGTELLKNIEDTETRYDNTDRIGKNLKTSLRGKCNQVRQQLWSRLQKCWKQTIKVEPSRTDRSPVDFSEIPRCWTTHLVK